MYRVNSANNDDKLGESHCLFLCERPLRFEPVSKITHVFYDESSEQVFAVRGSGATGVVVKSPEDFMRFRIEDKGAVISIKFSPDRKILAIQRSKSSVDFLNMINGEPDSLEYSQICKGKSSNILGYVWTDSTEITFVTDHGVEIYQVVPDRRTLKLSKTLTFHINWFVYQPTEKILLLSMGTMANQLQAIQFKKSYEPFKYPKFEVDFTANRSSSPSSLPERDVILTSIYGNTYVAILRHLPRSKGNLSSEVDFYLLQRCLPARKTVILKLDMSGRFALNVVDNLVVVHNQSSKTSAIFDIVLNGESDGYVTYHDPFVSGLSVKPAQSTQTDEAIQQPPSEMYGQGWVVFQPDVIIDARSGHLWHVQLRLQPLLQLPDKAKLVDFLLHRDPSCKPIILNLLRDLLLNKPMGLSLLSSIFHQLNTVYRHFLNLETRSSAASVEVFPTRSSTELSPAEMCNRYKLFVDQSDMYTSVFSVVAENQENGKLLVWVLMEYIRSLYQLQIPVQHFLYELVINSLVQQGSFYQLHQLLQYNVLSNSKPLACLMLSLEGVYPPAHQLGLDMLKKLGTANEEIVEVLLSKQLIIPSLRFIQTHGNVDVLSARKFLEAAKSINDPFVFYSVYKFFEKRNLCLRGKSLGEHCEAYVQHFQDLFNSKTISSNLCVDKI